MKTHHWMLLAYLALTSVYVVLSVVLSQAPSLDPARHWGYVLVGVVFVVLFLVCERVSMRRELQRASARSQVDIHSVSHVEVVMMSDTDGRGAEGTTEGGVALGGDEGVGTPASDSLRGAGVSASFISAEGVAAGADSAFPSSGVLGSAALPLTRPIPSMRKALLLALLPLCVAVAMQMDALTANGVFAWLTRPLAVSISVIALVYVVALVQHWARGIDTRFIFRLIARLSQLLALILALAIAWMVYHPPQGLKFSLFSELSTVLMPYVCAGLFLCGYQFFVERLDRLGSLEKSMRS